LRKELFIDLETNDSLDPKTGTITQIGVIYRVNGAIKIKKDFKEDIYNTFLEFLNTCVNRFDKHDKMYFIAYNAKFDSDFIRELFEKNNNKWYGSYFYSPCIDVMQFAAFTLLLSNKRPENFKLSTVGRYFGIKVDENKLHDALYDIEITKELFNRLKKIYRV
jgi:DNA polymerase-3 subunit epsilon